MPLFSIIIPTYNRAYRLTQAIESVLKQFFGDFEIIVVNDGSTDNTDEVLSLIKDERVKYCSQTNKGVSAARNTGAEMAVGVYLLFKDDDDEVTESWLSDFSRLVKQDHSPDVLLCACKTINPLTNQVKIVYPDSHARFLNVAGSFAVKKSLFLTIGGYDENLRFSENTELFIRIRSNNPVIAITNSINFIYFSSSDGGSKNLRNKILSNQIILQKHSEFYKGNLHGKLLLTQIIGVSYMRLGDFNLARKYLLAALTIKPIKIKNVIRYLLTFVPVLSRKVYNV